MTSWTYDYVDGTLEGVRHGIIGVDVLNMHDYKGHITVWKKSNGDDYFSVDIPTQNIVDIQHYEIVEKGKSKGLLYGAIGGVALAGLLLTPLGPVMMGAQVMALAGKITVGTALFSGVGTGLIMGAGADVLKGIKDKFTKNNAFIISYLEEKDPENLKMIILEHGKMFLKDAMRFFDVLIEQDSKIEKSYFVERFIKKLNDEAVEDTEANFLMNVSPANPIFKIQGDGITVTGKVGRGKINRGDDVWVCSPNYAKITKAKIVKLKKSKDEVENITYGDNASVLLTGIDRTHVGEDFILTTNIVDVTPCGSEGQSAKVFYADVKVFDESGNEESLWNGEHVIEFDSHTRAGKVELPPSIGDYLPHGQEDAIKVTLEEPIYACAGVQFNITASDIVIATGIISDFD